MRGIRREDFAAVGQFDFVAADDEGVFAAELGFNVREGVFHGLAIFGLRVIDERLVVEFATLD